MAQNAEKAITNEQISNNIAFIKANIKTNPEAVKAKLLEMFPWNHKNPCSDFMTEYFCATIRNYIDDICKCSAGRPIITAMAAFATLSTFVGPRVYYPFSKKVKLYSNLFIVCIAESASFKTTSLREGSALAKERQSFVYSEKTKLEGENLSEDDFNDKFKKILWTNKLLANSSTWQLLMKSMSTQEACLGLYNEVGMLMEMLLKQFSKEAPKQLTDIHDCEENYTCGTIKRGESVIKLPFLSICAVSTATWTESLMTPEYRDSGLLSRFSIVNVPPSDKKETFYINIDNEINKNYMEEIKLRCDILEETSESNKESIWPKALLNEDGGNELMEIIFELIKENIKQHEMDLTLVGFARRWGERVTKFGMINEIFSLHDPGEVKHISIESIIAGYSTVKCFVDSTIYALKNIYGVSQLHKNMDCVLKVIQKLYYNGAYDKKGKEVIAPNSFLYRSDITKRCGDNYPGSDEFTKILKALEDQGKIEAIYVDPVTKKAFKSARYIPLKNEEE